LEAWERVLVDAEKVADDVHGDIACTECHLGNDVDDFEEAHEGLIADPSDQVDSICADCHGAIAEAADDSLHSTLAGYDTALHERSVPENHVALEEMQANHCNSCHASCGQCHISQPASVGGGLLDGHAYVKSPPMTRTCTGCHGSRVRDEYTGRNVSLDDESIPADVHFTQGRMSCIDCHTGDEMHGMGMADVDHRYDGERKPKCEDCHADVVGSDSDIQQHAIHGDDLSCHVCHSVAYKSCDSCHVQQTEDGIPYYELEASYMDFRIGRNPAPTEERPWEWILVRHAPIAPDAFDYYGENLMPNFDERPTWLEATPHNIQRNTPQNASCNACHGNAAIFLTEDAVSVEELLANLVTLVEEVPSSR
jgi:thiosulfate/3-mercaptopyruvate sulfurtransferase